MRSISVYADASHLVDISLQNAALKEFLTFL